MRCIIAGGRDFTNYLLFKEKVGFCLKNVDKEKLIIISGGALGADTLAINYADENNISLEVFTAHWGLYGKSAGPKRNKEMAEYSTHLIAFWDGKSKGTKNMIDCAKECNLPTRIIHY